MENICFIIGEHAKYWERKKKKYISLLNVWKKIPESVYQQDVDHRQDEEQSQL